MQIKMASYFLKEKNIQGLKKTSQSDPNQA